MLAPAIGARYCQPWGTDNEAKIPWARKLRCVSPDGKHASALSLLQGRIGPERGLLRRRGHAAARDVVFDDGVLSVTWTVHLQSVVRAHLQGGTTG